MIRTINVIFEDGVLKPESPVDLEPNKRYVLTIQDKQEPDKGAAWDTLGRLAGTIEEPPDWSSEHDHYLYGTPRRDARPAP